MFGLFKSKSKSSTFKEDIKVDSTIVQDALPIEEKTQESFEPLSIDQLKNLEKDEEVLEYLKKAWEIEKNESITVFGLVSSDYNSANQKYFTKLTKIKSFENHNVLEYPVSNLKNEKMQDKGIFLEYAKNENSYNKRYISCNLILSSKEERGRKNNPLLLQVDKKSIETCQVIPKIQVVKNEEGSILVEESIVNHYVQNNKKKLDYEISDLIDKREKIEKKVILLNENYKKYEYELFKSKEEQKVFLLGIKEQKKEKNFLINEIEQIKKQIKKDKTMREENLKKIKEFVESKAKSLLDLEFINQSEYDKIMGNYPQDKNKDGKFLDFNKDFKGDYSKVISHIQAYLFAQNTIYYRYLLEDYFSSIQTNDLIILAGDSGSGKTNLVKKFAEVVGGVAKIIPVKPNWTSSDDLLGYYNPLQKSYLSTPFLDALIEASQNPKIPYFICLDEMNLARVEYYFADFLSLLEEREKQPIINLYSAAESIHIISEFNHVLTLIDEVKKNSEKKIVTFIDIMKDEKVNEELKKLFGFGDKDSLIKYHSDLRRMISDVLNIPSSIIFPKNVRIIGTINVDDTTYNLSPKILDRAHVIKLNSPSLSDWSAVEEEVKKSNISDKKYRVNFNIEDFGIREPYPPFNPEDAFCREISSISENYLNKLGIDVSLRSVRQGLNYNKIFSQFNSSTQIALNNFFIHKILPRFTFDGNIKVDDKEKIEIIDDLRKATKEINSKYNISIAKDELGKIIKKSQENDGIVNYWA